MTRPRPPESLDDAGRQLWRSLVAVYELSPAELETLRQACRAVDIIARIDAVLIDSDLVVEGHHGQPRSHPLLAATAEQRRVLDALFRILRCRCRVRRRAVVVLLLRLRRRSSDGGRSVARWWRRPPLDIPPWLSDPLFADEAMAWLVAHDLSDPRVFAALQEMLATPVPVRWLGGGSVTARSKHQAGIARMTRRSGMNLTRRSAMTAGWSGPWPAWLHAHHSRRRWGQAKYAYEKAHPAFATQQFNALLESVRERRARRDAGS